MTLRRQALLAGLVLAIGLGAVAVAPTVVARVPFFRIHAIEIVGTRYLDDAEVIARLALPAEADILVPLEPIRAAARDIPGVEDATVTRRWPGTLRVELVEAIPVALTPQDDRLVLVDRRGHVLPFDPQRLPASVPLAEHDSATAALLARMRRTDALLYDQVERAWREGGDVYLARAEQRVRLRADADIDALRAVLATQAWLAANGTPWRELDARFHGRVFVRRGAV